MRNEEHNYDNCCEHDHDHEHHHHDHEDDCCCGHDHEHEHHHHHHDEENAEPAVCPTCGKPLEACTCGLTDGNKKKIYILENLGCANCAAKMEKKISELDGISSATITFATKQLRITAKQPEQYLPQIQDICSSIESEVKVLEMEEAKAKPQKDKEDQRRELIMILVGAGMFLAGEVLERIAGVPNLVPSIIYIVAYLLLGGEILLTAGKNILKGQVFDENFLMSIATLGALVTACRGSWRYAVLSHR